MKFSRKRPVKIVMLGAGGTGGHIAPPLYRLLYSLERPVRFIICDGDIVEEKNLVRQNFTPADRGENKARVLAERYSSVFGLEAEYVPSFVETEEQLRELLRPDYRRMDPTGPTFLEEMVLLLGAVDNNRSRQLCHRIFHQATASSPARWYAACAGAARPTTRPSAWSTRMCWWRRTSSPRSSPARRRPCPRPRAWRLTSRQLISWWIWSTISWPWATALCVRRHFPHERSMCGRKYIKGGKRHEGSCRCEGIFPGTG